MYVAGKIVLVSFGFLQKQKVLLNKEYPILMVFEQEEIERRSLRRRAVHGYKDTRRGHRQTDGQTGRERREGREGRGGGDRIEPTKSKDN
jgi:hypothetical protein